MLSVGEVVEDFELTDQHGEPRRLSQLLGDGPVVLFFYPKASTKGCTKESCHFRDLGAEFTALGAQRVGISADPVERQADFDDAHDLGYPLLSDTSRSVAAQFGVKRPGPLLNRRATFVIGPDMTILGAFASEMNMDLHADEALKALRSQRV